MQTYTLSGGSLYTIEYGDQYALFDNIGFVTSQGFEVQDDGELVHTHGCDIKQMRPSHLGRFQNTRDEEFRDVEQVSPITLTVYEVGPRAEEDSDTMYIRNTCPEERHGFDIASYLAVPETDSLYHFIGDTLPMDSGDLEGTLMEAAAREQRAPRLRDVETGVTTLVAHDEIAPRLGDDIFPVERVFQ